jgi:hypothetical protein
VLQESDLAFDLFSSSGRSLTLRNGFQFLLLSLSSPLFLLKINYDLFLEVLGHRGFGRSVLRVGTILNAELAALRFSRPGHI